MRDRIRYVAGTAWVLGLCICLCRPAWAGPAPGETPPRSACEEMGTGTSPHVSSPQNNPYGSEPVPISSQARSVRLVLQNPSGLQALSWPITTGVPFPKDSLKPTDQVRLVDSAGRELPVQTRVTSTWGPQGSVRWLLVDFQARLDGGTSQSVYELRFEPSTARVQAASPLAIRQPDPQTIEMATGPLTLVVRRDRFDLLHKVWRTCGGKRMPVLETAMDGGPYLVDADGETYRAAEGPPDEVLVEETGPLRGAICVKGWHYAKSGKKLGRYVTRIHAFAGLPWVRVLHTFIVTEGADRARFRDVGINLPQSTRRVVFGGDVAAHDLEPRRSMHLLQYDSDKFHVHRGDQPFKWEERPEGRQAAGWMRGSGPALDTTVVVQDFWQQFPKEFSAVGQQGLTLHLWPAHGVASPHRPVTDAMLQYLWFCHEGSVLDFHVPETYANHKGEYTENDYRYVRASKNANPIGLAKTHEFLVWFHEPAEADAVARACEHWQEEPVCLAEPGWMCASGVFGRLHRSDRRQFPEVEEKLSKAFDCERRLEAHTRDYGMFNFGDGHTTWDFGRKRWSDVYRCWRASHHGSPRVAWLLYVRSGDPKFLRYALRNSRHVMDVDICHYTTPELQRAAYPLGKIVGALNDYKGLVHWHSGNRLFDYNSMTDFLLYYYYLTGDHRGLDVALEWGQSVKERFRKPTGTRSGAGVTDSLIELYQATWDPEYKRIADRYVDTMFDKVQNMDGTRRFSDDIVHYFPDKKGKLIPVGAFPQWENYAPWIQRYYDLTGDARTGQRIVAWANAYRAGFGDACSTWDTGEYLNILAYAYFVSKDRRYLSHGLYVMNRYLDSIEDAPGTLYDGFPRLGQMSHGPGYMAQRIPYFLSALAEAGGKVPFELPPPKPFPLLITRERTAGKKLEYVRAVIEKPRDVAFHVLARGLMDYDRRTIHVSVKAPDGKEVVARDVEFTKGPMQIDVPVPADGQTGSYQVSIRGEGSGWQIAAPLRTEPSLNLVYPIAGAMIRLSGCRYHISVPAGATELSMVTSSVGADEVNYRVYDPEGWEVARVEVPAAAAGKPHTQRTAVKPTQAGKTWVLEGRKGIVNLRLEGQGARVQPYLATEGDRFFTP